MFTQVNYTGINMLYFSQRFDQSPWTETGASISSVPVADPFGGTTAEQLIEDTSSGNHFTAQIVSKPTQSLNYTFSDYWGALQTRK